ncbi:MAG: hypothetical protein M1343_06880 [Chloroflexi bacterium]|nr:hypothetical protein [Chloroflexota bacterium]
MQSESTLTISSKVGPTQHAMLIVWGHFAHSIGLTDQLQGLPICQKTVAYPPTAKLTEFLIGLLAGNEYLTDLSEAASPLVKDLEVAAAWQLPSLAAASSVSRTLKACDDRTVTALQEVLEAVSQPFVQRAVSDLRERNEVILLDADLTGLPVSSTSRTYPGAAFGYMDGKVRLGYQLAQLCLQTHLFGRQWLSARHHPGNSVSCQCLLELLADAERRLGCHPRRRPELVAQRIVACEQTIGAVETKAVQKEAAVAAQLERVASLQERLARAHAAMEVLLAAPLSSRQSGPYSTLSRLQKQMDGWQGQLRRAEARLARLRKAAQEYRQQTQRQQEECERLRTRWQELCAQNDGQPDAPRCKIRIDAGFCNGQILTELIELGYEVETKSANDALVRTLRKRADSGASWTRVGDNAEMVAWTGHHIRNCPYPLTVGLERFHTPKEVLHAVLIRSQDDPQAACPDLQEWFHTYNGRQTIEAGNKEEKGTFKVQHLMSHSASGIRIQCLLTVFAANFVRWADEWVRPRVEQTSTRFEGVLGSPKRLVRVAANSPGVVDRTSGELRVRFGELSSFAGVVICLSAVRPVQLRLALFGSDHFLGP